jgi:hypothetical protein
LPRQNKQHRLKPVNSELALAEEIAKYHADPLGFVLFAYPWGERGPLRDATGPDKWQREFLEDLGRQVRERAFNGVDAVAPIRMAVSSGHGIGKSVLVAWLVNWILSTRPNCIGTVTANTFVQLSTKTWSAIQTWTKRSINAHWFVITGERIFYRDAKESWFVSAQTSTEDNSEAFAGQHAANSSSFYVFDEASAIPDRIWEVAEGGLTDGQPMFFCFGNPTRSSGKFYKAAFGSDRHRWTHRSIDSRDSERTNKAQIAEWLADYGEDSDFFRVRVKGVPPNASELQFIPADLVRGAQMRETKPLADEPLIAGVDVSGGGAAWNVVRFRRGVDARSIPPIRIPGEHGRDREVMITQLAAVLADETPAKRVAMMFIDSAFGAPICERLHVLGFKNRVVEVNFGGRSPDIHQANQRAYMWQQLKDWLAKGNIDKNDEKLEIDLTGPGYHIGKSNQLVIEAKAEMQKRNVPSPDDADALALTFARPVANVPKKDINKWARGGAGGWMS